MHAVIQNSLSDTFRTSIPFISLPILQTIEGSMRGLRNGAAFYLWTAVVG